MLLLLEEFLSSLKPRETSFRKINLSTRGLTPGIDRAMSVAHISETSIISSLRKAKLKFSFFSSSRAVYQ